MSYSINCYLLASVYGKEKQLSDPEIARLAQEIQTHLEEEIDNILCYRKQPHATANGSPRTAEQ